MEKTSKSNATQPRARSAGVYLPLSVGGWIHVPSSPLRPKCGKTKSIPFDDLGELDLRYLKSVEGPYSAQAETATRIPENISPVSRYLEQRITKAVEKVAGQLQVPWKFTFDAPPRCRKCHSTNDYWWGDYG